CAETLVSRRSSLSLLIRSRRYRALTAVSRSSQSRFVFCAAWDCAAWMIGGTGYGGGFRRCSSSMDNLCPDSELIFHDLLSVLLFVEPVIPALHALRCGVGDVLPAFRPPHLVALALHQGNKLFPGGGVLHTQVDGTGQPELPTLALGGGAIFSTAYPLLFHLL